MAACRWCGEPIPARVRRDAVHCSVRCRQASWRFGVHAPSAAAAERSLRFGYADPPYPGRAGLYPERTEVDHRDLVVRLMRDTPDGWGLSTSADALQRVLGVCPPGVRVSAWLRPVRRTRSARALSSWEPLILCGGRPLATEAVQQVEDGLVYRGRYRALPGALIGMKPPQFCVWLFEQLGARPGDVLVDLYPGSGAVGRAWRRFAATEVRDVVGD